MSKYLFATILLLSLICITNISGQYQKVNSYDLDVYYRIFGKGTPILIIGGGPGDNSDRYLSLCELLAEDFKCILPDQRGTGKSIPAVYDSATISISLTVEDFEAIRKSLDLEEWTVLGFSYGGYLASAYVQSYPSAVSNLILLGSMGLNTDTFNHFMDNITCKLTANDLAQVEYWNDSIKVAEDFHHAITEQIRAKMPGYFYDRQKSLIVSNAIKDSDFNFKMSRWIWNDIIGNDLDLAKKETNYDKPVLILHGRQDPVGESIPQYLSQYYTSSSLVFVEKCGHYSWIEQPEKIYSSIKSFLVKNE